jgi:hypothetical protein
MAFVIVATIIMPFYSRMIKNYVSKTVRLWHIHCADLITMIRKLKSGKYRLYSRKKNPKTNKRRNLGTFDSLQAAQKHEREVQYFKRH